MPVIKYDIYRIYLSICRYWTTKVNNIKNKNIYVCIYLYCTTNDHSNMSPRTKHEQEYVVDMFTYTFVKGVV